MTYKDSSHPAKAPPGAFFKTSSSELTGESPPFFYPPELLAIADAFCDAGSYDVAHDLLDSYDSQGSPALAFLLARAALLHALRDAVTDAEPTALPMHYQKRLF